ncbi:MAG: BamA/TamA family outer membrane protein [Bacteroidales bacterium]
MKKHLFRYFLLLSALLACTEIFSQNVYNLKIIVNNKDQKAILKKYSYKKEFKDTLSRKEELNDLLYTLWQDGYMAASIDSLIKDSITILAYLNIGEKYLWVNLKKGNVENALLQEAGYKEKTFSGKPVDYRDVVKLNEKIIKYCENNGYPFASVRLDSIAFSDSSLLASIHLSKNGKVEIDSVVMRGKARLAMVYLQNYLNIKSGDLYDESKVSVISIKIKELQFLREIRPFNIIFNNTKAKIVIYADKKKNSQFDGVLGVLPNSQTTGNLMLTGEANLSLINSFYRGEMIDINWRKLQQNTQDLKMGFVYPYLLNTPFGADIKFKLYKNDTLYINIERNLGVRYIFTGNNYIKAFVENHTSSLISTSQYKYATKLPAYSDVSSTMYGLEYKMQKLDYLLNPRKGFDIKITGSAGNKHIKKNPDLNEELYEGIKINSTQYKLGGMLSYYIPVIAKSTIKLGMDAAALQSENMFENELFRIGGLKSLRGFDEEVITASFYNIATIEYRFLFEQNSYLFAFWNGAYYESRTVNKFIHDTPYGFGAGVCFETKAGIFSLSYALGKQFNNPIYFKSAKIHFGIVNYF